MTWGYFFCFCFAIGFGTFLGQGGKNLEKTLKKIGPWRRSEEKLDRRKWCVFFCFSIGFGPVGFLLRIGVICMKISDRSKLQEWKQIRKQDD